MSFGFFIPQITERRTRAINKCFIAWIVYVRLSKIYINTYINKDKYYNNLPKLIANKIKNKYSIKTKIFHNNIKYMYKALHCDNYSCIKTFSDLAHFVSKISGKMISHDT